MMKAIAAVFSLLVSASAVLAQDQQLGARTKAMGGSYTAFEDDPVSIWLNPAGIATQADQFALAYQTYGIYEIDIQSAAGSSQLGEAENTLVEPAILPSYAGCVFQLGTPAAPMALGICFARPFHIKYVLDEFETPAQAGANAMLEQSLSRFRVALARDFRLAEEGKGGFLSHIALGVGADIGYERWEFFLRSLQSAGGSQIFTIENVNDNSFAFGGGAGVLIGLFDNLESFKVNVGVAYQSKVDYDFNLNLDRYPQFDMPQQINAGVTVYLLEGMPLRLTVDFQWIDWSETAPAPTVAGQPGFEDALNFSVGMEYRFKLTETLSLYPRAGYRRFDAPWGDAKNLPMTSRYKLALDTDDSTFNIFTFGAGVSWTTEAGKVRSVDLAGDVGGDEYNLAFGTTVEF